MTKLINLPVPAVRVSCSGGRQDSQRPKSLAPYAVFSSLWRFRATGSGDSTKRLLDPMQDSALDLAHFQLSICQAEEMDRTLHAIRDETGSLAATGRPCWRS
jgi:hypothetical protein